jgi:glutaminyl-tRNA synthetase
MADASFLDHLNPDSLERVTGAYGEPCLGAAKPGDRFQFERLGYFAQDPDTAEGKPVFNKTVGLRDTWAKIEKKSGKGL